MTEVTRAEEGARPAPSGATGQFSIICVSPQPWDADLPTNRQQIMRRAAARGHRVVFVESGSFLLRDARRLLRRPWTELRRRLAGRTVADRITVRNGLNVVPWGKRYGLASRLNFALTAVALRRAARTLPQPVVLWLYDPAGAALTGSLGEAFAVYDCVDDYAEQYAPDRRRVALVAAADAEAGRSSRLVFATTSPLTERHLRTNRKTYLVRNAADYEHFCRASDRAAADPEVRDLPRPIIGFAGNFLATKVDFSLLELIAHERRDWTLLLVGPARTDSENALERLTARPNVAWLGWKPYDDLPRYVAAFDVGLCPYLANVYTRNVFPLKVYEYLAAGKAVVATGTPSLRGMEPDIVVVDGQAAALAEIEAALERSTDEDRSRRMALAKANTWDARTSRLLELIEAELAATRSSTP